MRFPCPIAGRQSNGAVLRASNPFLILLMVTIYNKVYDSLFLCRSKQHPVGACLDFVHQSGTQEKKNGRKIILSAEGDSPFVYFYMTTAVPLTATMSMEPLCPTVS